MSNEVVGRFSGRKAGLGRRGARLSVVLLCCSMWGLPAAAQTPLGTDFTYQGRLTDAGFAANGTYDLQFKLFEVVSGGSQVGSTLTRANVPLSNGLFTTSLDFGAAFAGSKRWLEIGVKLPAAITYTLLTPRQELTPSPNAVFAANAAIAVSVSGPVASSQITGPIPGEVPPAYMILGTTATAPPGFALVAPFGIYYLFIREGTAPGPFTLTVSRSGGGSGTVASAPAGITCGADCSEPYSFGTQVTLTAAPNPGSAFAGWSGGGCSGAGTCIVTITAASTVTATFTTVATPALLVITTPMPVSFGSVPLGTFEERTITVLNAGGTSTSVVITFTQNDDFSFSIVPVSDSCSGNILTGGASCTVNVRFSPTTLGGKAGGLTLTADSGSSATANMGGIGI